MRLSLCLFGATLIRNSAFFSPFYQAKKFQQSIVRMSNGVPDNLVKTMTVGEFEAILKGDTRGNYQIIDVREPSELSQAALSDSFVLNLPLSQAQDWASKLETGYKLDNSKPTICLCHHGMRSMRVAQFLTQQAGFDEVYNLDGGIHKYADKVDPKIGFY